MSEDAVQRVETAEKRIMNFSRNTKKTASKLPTNELIQLRIQLLDDYWEKYQKADALLEAAIKQEPAIGKDPTWMEFEDVEEEYILSKGDLQQMIRKNVSVGANDEIQVQKNVRAETNDIRMKAIDVPTFSGDIEDWVSFKDIFKSLVGDNTRMSEVHKLQHLKVACKGKSAELVKHIAVTAANYMVAWEALVDRYENERLLVSKLLERLMDLPAMKKECPIELTRLLDGTNQSVRLLEALGRATDHWDDWLVVQTTRKLDYTTRLAWEKSIGATTDMPTYAQLEAYLSGVLRSYEAVKNMSQHGVSSAGNFRAVRSHVVGVGSRDCACLMCNEPHGLYKCPKFLNKSIAERRQFITQKMICYNCIASTKHVSRDCPSRYRCLDGGQHHHTLLHTTDVPTMQAADRNRSLNPFRSSAVHTTTEARGSGNDVPIANSHHCNKTECENGTVLLATAYVNVMSKNGSSVKLRALIDQGSQATFVTEDAIQRLGVSKTATNIVVVGIGETTPGRTHARVELAVTSCLGKSRTIHVNALVLQKITTNLPNQPITRSSWPHLDSLTLADTTFGRPGRIDMLLGADVYADLMLPGFRTGHFGEPMAQQTIFGWILIGKTVTSLPNPASVTSMHVQLDKLLRKFWEVEELQRGTVMSNEDQQCEQIYEDTTTRSNDGKYVVSLPFRSDARDLGESRTNAVRRLLQMEKRFSKNPELLAGYAQFMAAYLSLGHMELIPAKDIDQIPNCYLPHHAVLKPESSSTKLRVVFDATLATTSGKGLNDILLTGPRLQENLSAILMRWRKHAIVISADVEKMYRQIWVKPEHQTYQRIVWRKNSSEPIREYRLKTVTYGTASAPYMAIKTLQRLAEDEKDRYGLASKVLKTDFYVDDCLSGADTIDEALKLKDELLNIAKAGGLRLLKWSSNNGVLLQTLPEDHKECRSTLNLEDDDTVKALGIRWHPAADDFSYKVTLSNEKTQTTKREILAEISKLFDPLGLLAPIIITAKILMQQLWLTGVNWDDKLPEEVCNQWRNFQHELASIEAIRIKRWIGHRSGATIELHGFSDASRFAYAACVYVRVIREDGSVTVTLLAAKSKVAPIKQQSIPRLELNGAVLLANLLKDCKVALSCGDINVYVWTDSMVVLAWIRRHAHVWPTFIANRVSEIQGIMSSQQWHHVPGVDNPADVASRGISPAQMMGHSLWWNGPQWLKDDPDCWPQLPIVQPDSKLLEERMDVQCHVVEMQSMWELAEKYSSWSKLIRVTAYCRRVFSKIKKKDSTLDTDEIEDARSLWVRLSQRHEFKDVIKNIHSKSELHRHSLTKLRPFVDDEGILRVGGRLENANMSYAERHPIILHGRNTITRLIIMEIHQRTLHGGPQLTIGKLHQQYWIIQERRTVRSIIHNCITCFKAQPRSQAQLMGNLPPSRITMSRPFTHTGLDYAGPIWSRTTKGRGQRAHKSWIAVFVCFSTKAVHLDLVSDLSTQAFIAAFRRFTARRGRCSEIYCDNGTNFVGANKELQAELRKCLKDEMWKKELGENGTRFNFAPAGSPHFNGLAESTVKMAKLAMKKIIGESKLTYEEMATFLSQVEAILNSRPLYAISSDSSDPNALTPGHFLIGQPLTAVPGPNITDTTSMTNRWQLVQRMVQHFWKRWGREYLHQLQQMHKWQTPTLNIKIGDVVLINEDCVHPTLWKLGRIVETHPGADGLVRVVTIQTKSSKIKRSVTKISVLPIEK